MTGKYIPIVQTRYSVGKPLYKYVGCRLSALLAADPSLLAQNSPNAEDPAPREIILVIARRYFGFWTVHFHN